MLKVLLNRYKPFLPVILAVLLGQFSCAKKSVLPESEPLAIVGDRVVTVDEFVRRAEYTIRPPYCRGDNYIHKKIILNSLIAEKLFALEADTTNELCRNPEFQRYIQGRREQAMRQTLFYQIGYQKTKVTEKDVRQYYRNAGRKYRVRFVTFNDRQSAIVAVKKFKNNSAGMGSLSQLTEVGKSPGSREISFSDESEPAIHEALFAKSLKKNQIIGPIQTEDKRFLVIQVDGWTDRVVITDTEIQKRWNDVKGRVTENRAQSRFVTHVRKLMSGKQIVFEETTLMRLSTLLSPMYLKDMEEKKEELSSALWRREVEEKQNVGIAAEMERLRSQPFFTIDGKTWTVEEFETALESHPLVFRKRKFDKKEFPKQFQLAIVDLIRDSYVTADAYRRRLDKEPSVCRYEEMWRDNLISLYEKQRYLEKSHAENISAKDYQPIIDRYLNPYVDSLQAKYSDRIRIDMDAFEKIRLSRIDVVAYQKNVPYPILVPHFPLVTTDVKLNYGQKMNPQE
ncbi:MAG: peptidylprolyl isomerase [Candidatus Neomarinimicrobiota bacterium]